MFCAACGSTLQNEAQFCPRCGKRSVLDEVTSDTALPEAPANTEIDTDDNRKMLEPEQSPQSETNPALPASEANATTNAVAQAVSAEFATGNSKVPNRYVNVGTITLGVAALIGLILGAVQGFIPRWYVWLVVLAHFGRLIWPTLGMLRF